MDSAHRNALFHVGSARADKALEAKESIDTDMSACVSLLIRHGAVINARDSIGQTPLLSAARGSWEMV